MKDVDKFKIFLENFRIEYEIQTERDILTGIYNSEDQERSLEEYFQYELDSCGEELERGLNSIWINVHFDTYPKTEVSFYFDHNGNYKHVV